MRSSSCSNTRGALLATWFSVVLLGSTIGRAAASDDWLDEMPAVETVAQALARVYTDLKDDDWPAANLAGTLILLRHIMALQSDDDGNMTPARLAKMSAIAHSYMRAELAVGLGVGYQGDLTTAYKCTSDDCFRQSFPRFRYMLSSVSSAYYHHTLILPLLFPCERAEHYVERVRANVFAQMRTAGYRHLKTRNNDVYTSPAVTLSLPGEAMVGTRPLTAATACDAYGGDADADGLCDDWGKPLPKSTVAAKEATRCGSLALTKVTTCADPILDASLGPSFKTMDEAAEAALKKALQLTVETATFCSQVEWGGAIYQLGICNDFRFVDPIKGDSGQVSGPDMAAAYNELAAPLEQQGLKPMIVATYHSHTTGRNYLSINDINAAIKDKRVIYMTAYKEKNGVRVTQKYEPKWDHKRVDPLPRPDVLSFCGIEIPLTPQEQQRAEKAREAAYKQEFCDERRAYAVPPDPVATVDDCGR